MSAAMGKSTYAWVTDKEDSKKRVKCYASTADTQKSATRLVEAQWPSNFHDKDVAAATKAINLILARIERENNNPKRDLAFIRSSYGIMLCWTEHAVSALDDPHTVNKTLGII